MALLTITTPRGKLVQRKTSGGTIKAQLTWSPSFAAERTKQLDTVQAFVDSEVIRLMAPYTPMQSGLLIKAATLGTVIGSGEVQQIAPYAAMQYYRTDITRKYDPRRGAKWFERMKVDRKAYILKGAAEKAGARYG